MRTFNSRLALAGVSVVVAALTGCSTVIDGTPSCPGCGINAEPEFRTPRPSATPPPVTAAPSSAVPSPAPGPTAPAPGAQTLPADESGYVFIQTKSGQTRCQLNATEVGCESQFSNAPTVEGGQANGVSVTSGGALRWVLGNLGAIPAVTLDYATYRAVGWTIVADSTGTRFTNDGTGRGMTVSTEGAEAF
ncbi:hypothetical protein [Mycolicibacterium fallax]|uniref:Uncharacterized protein n=1 Tax=Mycolicibacterium fallax TaxID=1793 RepID=A0A1X1RCT2_MYCFA|nr:hypothetical protein [Mycolicibacterium fallax]ORV03105.1 hypothetical protein AWC04_10725 [Mycolicibacterium fallax]BBY98901.1 hypothetical protein MFAL_23680 [Mycolicibacterium fallax]HOW94145.1 hypothetical protein [Mycolicibacterium fallax]